MFGIPKIARIAMINKDLRYRDLAARAACSQSYVRFILDGTRANAPRSKRVPEIKRRLARALGLKMADLWPKNGAAK